MASGVTLTDEVMPKYKDAKSWKFIIFKLVNKDTQIGIHKVLTEDDYDEFLKELPGDDCRFAVYHCEYESGEGTRARRVFYTWSPDIAKIKQKMLYASSKMVLRNSFSDRITDVQGTDFDEVSKEVVLEKIKRG